MLSKRLKVVASYLEKPIFFADIGSDHAYLPCYVCSEYYDAKAIAGEINEGPFHQAIKTVKDYGLEDRISVRKGNGLEVIEGTAVEQITIAGMGGKLITAILNERKHLLHKIDRLILQPNLDAHLIRNWLGENSYDLIDEEIIEEDGHIYEILVAIKCEYPTKYNENINESDYLFGPFLLKKKNEAFKKKWIREEEKISNILRQLEKGKEIEIEKIRAFKKRQALIKEVLNDV
ncbi:tRNA (adenine(22)-N(1))-methyltransferase [Saliterribacillus persicus]|uniref:tRNA (Adenine22-N1)-methyltransferase n=1 Tax=Saliterribacillus persicus TaxID=930114 RepID=A0A368XFT8_9BACI|nr:class I SAM-dependent methyltransferase [Saliterribacillus persicus]RCW65347.1 tRNA (adenine22-N1)-methyltransferase [Saliterribacillus persicus]